MRSDGDRYAVAFVLRVCVVNLFAAWPLWAVVVGSWSLVRLYLYLLILLQIIQW